MSPKSSIDPRPLRVLGRYKIHGRIAAGGMATVHLGRIVGAGGFSRLVAIKRMHESYALDPDFVAMFLDEARLAARIYHPNVVQTLDVIAEDGELLLVMEYVQGESLSRLLSYAAKSTKPPSFTISAAVAVHVLHGLHAAHEAKSENGQPLHIVHRDISPQNVLVGADGVSRIIDFGVAKATGRLQTTRDGSIKGKLRYMPPEQLSSREVDRRADVYSASIVLWEMLAGRRLIDVNEDGQAVMRVLAGNHPRPSEVNPGVPRALDDLVMRGLSSNPEDRWNTAQDMAYALEQIGIDTPSTVAEWVASLASDTMARRSQLISAIEADTSVPTADGWSRPESTGAVKDETGAPPSAVSVVRPSGVWKSRRAVQVGVGVAAILTTTAVVLLSQRSGTKAEVGAAMSGAAPSAVPLVIPGAVASVAAPASASAQPLAAPTSSAETTTNRASAAQTGAPPSLGAHTSSAPRASSAASKAASGKPTQAPPTTTKAPYDPYGTQ
jgi:serine/threonine-protein kinase